MTACTRRSILTKIAQCAKSLVEQAKISPYHIGSWAYVYTIVLSARSRAGRHQVR